MNKNCFVTVRGANISDHILPDQVNRITIFGSVSPVVLLVELTRIYEIPEVRATNVL